MAKTKTTLLFFLGATITLFFGLLAAFLPGLAYVQIQSYAMDAPASPLLGLPKVNYQPFELGSHMDTLKLCVSAIGGLIGLFGLVKSRISAARISIAAIAVSILGLMIPTIPSEDWALMVNYFYAPWAGSLLVAAGISLMFLGLALKNNRVPRFTLLGVPLLLGFYLLTPLMVLSNCVPWIIFGTPFNYVNLLFTIFIFAGQLLMIWGAYKGAFPPSKEPTATSG